MRAELSARPEALDAADDRGYTAYHFACGSGHSACVQALLKASCDTTKKNAVGA
jgi:ankyrin repeat protein